MVSPKGRNTRTVDDLVPYVEKLAIISQEQERIIEPVTHGPASECRFPPQQFHMLQSSVETQGFDSKGRLSKQNIFPNKWTSVAMECITRHQHFLSILHRCISILSRVMTLICLQANIRLVVLRKHILIFHGRLWPLHSNMMPQWQHLTPHLFRNEMYPEQYLIWTTY